MKKEELFKGPFLIFTLNPLLHCDHDLIQGLARLALEMGIRVVCRLNMSFYTPDQAELYGNFIGLVRQIFQEFKVNAVFEIDTPGQKLRLSTTVPDLNLEDHKKLLLNCSPQGVLVEDARDLPAIHLPYPWLIQSHFINKNELILLGDDEIRLRVDDFCGPYEMLVTLERVRKNARIRPKMGVTIAREDLPLPLISKADEEVMLFGTEHDIEWFGISTVPNAEGLRAYQAWIAEHCPAWRVVIIAKIELASAWEEMEAIISSAPAAMFAKGDGLNKSIVLDKTHEFPALEEDFAKMCRKYGTMSILATGIYPWPVSQAGLDSLYHAVRCLRPSALLFSETANMARQDVLEFAHEVMRLVRVASRELLHSPQIG